MTRIGPGQNIWSDSAATLHVGVSRGQHGGETRDLLLAAATFAGLLEVTTITNRPQRTLAVEFLLQTSQHLFDGLAFF